MRGSILYPKSPLARVTGAVFYLLLLVAAGFVFLQISRSKPREKTVSRSVSIDESSSLPFTKGAVYLLDPDQGKVIRAGSFDALEEPRIDFRLPERYQNRISNEGLFWRSYYQTAVPHISFVADDELREEWLRLTAALWKDPKIYDRLSSLLADFVAVWLKSENRFSPDRLLPDLMNDPEIRNHFEILLETAEPYLLEAVNKLLWNWETTASGPGEAVPNVKLIWAGRHLIFGLREPSITLSLRPADEGEGFPKSIHIEEIY